MMVIYAEAQAQTGNARGVSIATAVFATTAACNAALGKVQVATATIRTTAVCVPTQ
jgi:hypothetical protein